jgi:hypothetical protein
MALRKPSTDDLRRLATAYHFEMSNEEVEAYQALMPDTLVAALRDKRIRSMPLSVAARSKAQSPESSRGSAWGLKTTCALPAYR